MAEFTKGSKLFLERYGIKTTFRGPLPRIQLRSLPINDVAIPRPLPLPATVQPSTQQTTNDPWHQGPAPSS